MLVAQKTGAGSIPFYKDDMACGFETCAAPGAKKIVGAMPAVEAHAEAVLFERSVDFAEGGSNPRSAGVAGNAAPAAVAVATTYGGSVSTRSAHPAGSCGRTARLSPRMMVLVIMEVNA